MPLPYSYTIRIIFIGFLKKYKELTQQKLLTQQKDFRKYIVIGTFKLKEFGNKNNKIYGI